MTPTSVVERLRALVSEVDPDCGDPGCDDCQYIRKLDSIISELESVAAGIRNYAGNNSIPRAFAARLAPEPKEGV